jgi:hypothetical protein
MNFRFLRFANQPSRKLCGVYVATFVLLISPFGSIAVAEDKTKEIVDLPIQPCKDTDGICTQCVLSDAPIIPECGWVHTFTGATIKKAVRGNDYFEWEIDIQDELCWLKIECIAGDPQLFRKCDAQPPIKCVNGGNRDCFKCEFGEFTTEHYKPNAGLHRTVKRALPMPKRFVLMHYVAMASIQWSKVVMKCVL